jgi:hypothetical protein
MGFSLGASVGAELVKGLDFGASKSFCTTDAKVVRYSQALASTEINPYNYNGADTCRKIQKKGDSKYYLVIDRAIREITTDFWNNWIKDKTFEILPDISMFSVENHKLDANARISIDPSSNEYYLVADGLKHWLADVDAKNRCGFDFNKAAFEDMSTL